MALGDDIKRKRKAAGLSAEALADLIGVSKDNLYKWEKGTKPSDPEDYLKITAWLSGKVEFIPKKEKPGHEDQADELAQAKAEAKEANAVIRGYNLWMQRMMELNFSDLLSKQEGEIGIVIEILKLGARLESGGNPDKAREILADSLHRIGPDLSPKMKEDIERDARN